MGVGGTKGGKGTALTVKVNRQPQKRDVKVSSGYIKRTEKNVGEGKFIKGGETLSRIK